MGCDPITFHKVTPTVFNCLKQNLGSAGISVPNGNEGDIQGDTPVGKMKGHFKWDGVSDLTVTITSKPFIVSCGTITGKLHDAVINCGGLALKEIIPDKTTTVPSTETIKDLTASIESIVKDLSDEHHKDLHYQFKANPVQVIKDYGGPVENLDKKTRIEMNDTLSNLDLLGSPKCVLCEVGLNALLVATGGAAAIAVAVLAGPEVLAASAPVAAIATFSGLAAGTVSTIILGVVSTVGGECIVVLEAVISAICKAMKACS